MRYLSKERRKFIRTDRRIVQTVRHYGPLSRAELARRLDLSKPTVSVTVESLLQQGMLHEVGRGQLPAGRSPRLLAFNARYAVVAGVDLGASNLRLCLADLDGQPLAGRVLPTPKGEDLAEQVAAELKRMQEETLPGSRLAAVVMGTPGVVDGERLRFAPNLPALERPDFLRRLRGAFPCPLEVHNDVNLAAIAEGSAEAEMSVAFLAIGTGLGAAVARGTTVWSGDNGRAGEIGYLPFVSPVGQILEETLSGVGLSRLYWHFGGRGGAEEALRGRNRAAQQAREVLLEALAYAVSVLTLSYDPGRIVLGGGVGLHLGPWLPQVSERLAACLPFVVPLMTSSQGDIVTQQGAVILAIRRAEQELW